MMRVVVRYGGTINIGNFENVKIEYELERDGIPADKAFAIEELRQIHRTLKDLFEETKEQVLTENGK